MDPLEGLENRIDVLIKQLTEKKAEIAGLRKQNSKISDIKRNELTIKLERDVDKSEKEFNELMKGIEEQFPVESDSESDSESSSDIGPSSPRPNAVIDLDEDGDEVVNDDFLEGLAVNKDQMEQELDKVLKMMKEIEVSPPPSIENMSSTVDSFANQTEREDFGKTPGDRRARMFRNREMSFNSAFMELSETAKYDEAEANELLASGGTGLTISDFTGNMSTSISSVTDSDEPESTYSMHLSMSPPPTREEVHKRLRSKAETFSQLINLVQLKEALAKGKLDITEEGEEEEDSLADLKIKAKDIIISNPIAQETIKRLSLSRGRNINRSSENFQALKVAAVPKAPQLILNIVINDVEGKAIAKNKIKISSEAKVIKVKEKILMKFDVNALASTSGSMGVFLVEYGIFLNNKRTLKSYDLKDEDKLILKKKPTQGLDYVSIHFPASPEIKLRNQQIKCQPDCTTLTGLIKSVDKYYSDTYPLPYEKYGLYSLKDMKWLPVNIKKPLAYWKLKNQDILEFREMTPHIMSEVKREEIKILESEQMSVSVLVEITKFLERTSVQMQFDETIQDVLKRVVDDIRRKNPEVSSDCTQYGFFTLTSNELLDETKTVKASMDFLKMAVVLKQKSKDDMKREKKRKLMALKEERKRQKEGKKEKRKSSDIKKKRRSIKSMKPEKTTTERVETPRRNNMSQSALTVAAKNIRTIVAESNN